VTVKRAQVLRRDNGHRRAESDALARASGDERRRITAGMRKSLPEMAE